MLIEYQCRQCRKISSFYSILSIATLIILVLWPNEGEFKLCLSSERYTNIPNQAACQYLCEKNTTCVGISYRPPSCHVCFNDKFESAVFGRHVYFFRRPGKQKFSGRHHFRNLTRLYKQTTEYLNQFLGYVTRVTSTGRDTSSPHCSYSSTCHYDEASKLECANALCKAKGYPGGLFVESSNDFCVRSLTADSVYVYLLDTNSIQISQNNAESRITADCFKGKIGFPRIFIFKYKRA